MVQTNMQKDSYKKWFFQRLTLDAFSIFTTTYIVLLVLELVKEGLVSRYISLPHLALILLVLGILVLAQQPPLKKSPTKLGKKEIVTLSLISLAIIAALAVIIQAALPLTILIIFVTVASLWIGTISLLGID